MQRHVRRTATVRRQRSDAKAEEMQRPDDLEFGSPTCGSVRKSLKINGLSAKRKRCDARTDPSSKALFLQEFPPNLPLHRLAER